MTLDELPAWAVELIERERVAHLGLLDDDRAPRVLPVTFARAGGALWSAVDDKPKQRDRELARVRWLRRRPRAALCVDRYDDDWSRLAWVQALGRVAVLAPEEGADGLEALVAKYEPYGRSRPPGPLLRLSVERVISWRAAG